MEPIISKLQEGVKYPRFERDATTIINDLVEHITKERGVYSSSIEPNPSEHKVWFNTNDNTLNIYENGKWNTISGQGGGTISGATISGATISGGYLTGSITANGATISGGNINGATLGGINVTSGSISYANISNAYINYSTLMGTINASGATINGATISGGTINNITVKSMSLSSDAIISMSTTSKISYGILQHTTIENGNITGFINASGATINGATISGGNINGATLGGINVTSGSISYANINGGNITAGSKILVTCTGSNPILIPNGGNIGDNSASLTLCGITLTGGDFTKLKNLQ